MDAWNKFVNQVTDVFKSMSPGARITAVLLFAVVIVGTAFLFRMPTGVANDYLLAGRSFSPSELDTAQAAFAEAGLSDYEVESTKIRVPRSKRAAYVAAMAEHNAIPPDFFTHYERALASDNPFVSQKVMDEKIRTAKQQTLSQFIRDFRGVSEAAVMYSESDKGNFRREKDKSAVVVVKTNGSGLDDSQVKAIRNLVAFAYAGLDRNKISISDASTSRSYDPEGGVDGDMGSNAYATHKTKFEADWKKKIELRLSHIPGVIVGVNVELNPEVRNQSSTIKFADKPVTVRASEATTESTSTAPDVGGAAGARANNVGDFRGNQAAQVSTTSQGAQSQQSTSKNETVNALGHEQRLSQQAALVPKAVSASIAIPRNYILKMWKEMQPPPASGEKAAATPDADTIKRLEVETTTLVENAVSRLLPERLDKNDKYEPIHVTFYHDIPAEPQPIPTFATQATQWAGDYWQSVAAVVLALFAMVMVRSMVGSIVPTPLAPSAPAKTAESSKDETKVDQPAVDTVLKQRRRLNSSGPNLKEELRDLVREDPDAAANVLKVWIGDAA
jgi:flagellar M-ring protein FliF